MKSLNKSPGNKNKTHTTLPLLPDLRNSQHLHALSDFFLTARRVQTRHLIIPLLLALSLTIPAIVLIAANGLTNASHNLMQARRISLFMTSDTTIETANQLGKTLITNNYVRKALLIPTLQTAGDAQLPVIMEVIPSLDLDADSVNALANQLEVLAGVEFVEFDGERLSHTTAAFELLSRLATIANMVALFIAAALMLILSRFDLKQNRNTIKLMKQLGGTHTDIRRPFLYRSPALALFAGIVGIVTAIALIWLAKTIVDTSSYESLVAGKPTLPQLFAFLAILVTAGIAATLRIFPK